MFEHLVNQLSASTKDLFYLYLDSCNISASPTRDEVKSSLDGVVNRVKQELQRTGDLTPQEDEILVRLPEAAISFF